MFIPDHKIEEIKAATDIVDVVSDYVQLKKRASSFVGLCPFHNEKTPSFNVNPALQIYKCFGCGNGGNAINFLMRIESIGFIEAGRILAERAGIELEETPAQVQATGERESIYHALRLAARYFYNEMHRSEEGRKRALAYFSRRRFASETMKTFGLGYAPDRWDGLLKHALASHIKTETLEKAGLVLKRSGSEGHYDRFRGRAMFPIFSHIGKVVGFGGRVLEDDSAGRASSEDQPKYINSPETRVYHKSEILYGLFQARREIRGRDEAIIVEGYTDVISLYQAGIRNVVSSSGTALTNGQIRAIGRYSRTVLLLYDADSAGLTAAERGIDLLLAEDMHPYLVRLPEGEDPDSFVRAEGAEAFRQYLDRHRENFVHFKHSAARLSGQLDTPEGQTQAMQSVLATIVMMPDRLAQESYVREASDVFGVPDLDLHRALNDLRKQAARRRKPPSAPPPRPESRGTTPAPREDDRAHPAAGQHDNPSESAEVEQGRKSTRGTGQAAPRPEEKILIRLMLEHGERLVALILSNMSLQEFTEGPSRKMIVQFIEMYGNKAIRRDPFLDGTFGDEIQSLAAEVLMDTHELSRNWELRRNITVPRLNEYPEEVAASAMQLLKLDRVTEAISDCRKEIFRAQQEGLELGDRLVELTELQQIRRSVEEGSFLNPGSD